MDELVQLTKTSEAELMAISNLLKFQLHQPARRALISNWPLNSFMMVVCEKYFSPALDRKF